jgi:hypothetical protein
MIKKENNFNFTEEQKEVLIGILLGDGHLEQMSEATYRLKIEQSAEKSEYINHLYIIFKDCCNLEPILKIKPNGNKSLFFQTKTSISLNFYGKQFYKNKIKIVPSLLARWLTPRVLAYWFMDDGSIKSKQSKGTILNTQGFTKAEVEFLIELLKTKFNLEAKIRLQKDGYQIYISGHSYELLKSLIYEYLLDSMKYKFPLERKIKIN